jgi:hypothetical protein
MERRHRRAKWRESETQDGLYQIASQAECAAAFRTKARARNSFQNKTLLIMKHEDPSRKRKTIRIQLPRKPAAPRHPMVMARAIPMPQATAPTEVKRSLFLYPLLQVTIASMLAAMILDGGESAHVVACASLGYVGGLALMASRRHALTKTDELLIRWGFPILCVLSFFVTQLVWVLRR